MMSRGYKIQGGAPNFFLRVRGYVLLFFSLELGGSHQNLLITPDLTTCLNENLVKNNSNEPKMLK